MNRHHIVALEITNDSKFIKGTLTNGEEYGSLINKDVIPYGYFNKREDLKEIIVPEGITSIESEAFLDCSSLTTVTIPDSLHRIEFNAFIGCTALQKIVLPSSLNEIDCWFDGQGVAKMTTSNPSSDELIKNLKEGYAIDFHYKGEYKGDHWD